ncbi:polysaccharide deacetylase family protein [Nostoc sp. ChiVER01]|uniref:polysaccharide deacetylase family protein n=1 Tax=Nostoc sp. ChiVER01 TaxID=3075382 RepID=UPI002AD4D77D|nr:polysaccharide deacetylase family protein [Nostoc sp. ChiVER01]MDZ8223202.1 polysaccharide deacetylase family protein [Nostoc sp. ChiVER01]
MISLPGLSKLRQTARRIRKRLTPGGLILLYHRVAQVDSDPWSLCVSPSHFAEHLEVLHRFGRVVQLQQLTQTLEQGKHPHRQFVITFDDGYADNLDNAKPLLEHYDKPATVFVTSGHIGSQHEFWWDQLERLLLQPGTLPEKLVLTINGSSYEWELGASTYYSKESYQHHHSWRASRQDSPTPRHSLYCSLYPLLRPLPENERQKILAQLLVWTGAKPSSRLTHRSLTSTELSVLEQGGLIEVGAHTVTHPFLSALPAPLQQEEIQRGKAELEEILGHSVSSFAYPYGDYTAETIPIVRAAGFARACSTTIAYSIGRHADCFQLPRVVVEDWDGDEFARQLKGWLFDE